MALATGTQLEHYEILSRIGAGGMGEVYLAQDCKLRRKVALKLLSSEFAEDRERLHRFAQEAEAAAALNHPNVAHIYEVNDLGSLHFIAMEYIEGETLRQRLARGAMNLREALDIAIQVASALAAAHRAGIIHRDIKPENIMVRPDGYVKVLDFGLAKLVETQRSSPGSDESTLSSADTDPGTIMGTIRYMSPEQARGKPVDARSDIFSFGVVLYEMLAGRRPFSGESIADTLAAILNKEPLPLPGSPPEAQRIVSKTLRKDRSERYQTINDLLFDLKDLRDDLQVQSKLDRSVNREPFSETVYRNSPTLLEEPLSGAIRQSNGVALISTSTTEYITSQIKKHKRVAIIAPVLLVAVALATYFYITRKPVLTEQDTILLADFVNTTGDNIFDGTLKQGLAVQLQQSPFLNLFPDVRVRQTLRLMNRSPDERVTTEVGLEICQRQGLKALISGAIAPLGSHYVITLEAINGRNGETLAREQTEAESKEQVLKALGRVASQLREKLGESLSSIQKFDAPLEATTSSLEALKLFSLGVEQTQNGKFLEAIPYYKQAVELDPNFAYAYGTLAVNYYNTKQPALAAKYATKAFELRERLSELEKLRITSFYYAFVTGEVEKGINALELYKQTNPRDERGPMNLSDRYGMIGLFEKSVLEAENALRLNPNNAVGYWDLSESLMRLNRFAEAREKCKQAIQLNLDTTALHGFLYQIAFIENDAAAMQEQLDWAKRKPDEYVALDWQAKAVSFAGQLQRAQDFSRRAVDLATQSDAKEVAARYAAEAALRDVILGQYGKTGMAAASLGLERNQVSLTRAALALALCGESSPVDELTKRYPSDTLINGLWLPTIRAAIAFRQGDAGQAIDQLQFALRYEAVAEFWPQYVRGEAYLKLRKGVEAAGEFQKILDHRGQAPLSVLYPLAHLGLARAATLSGDAEKSRKEYQNFFELWKGADTDVLVFNEAKKEYEKVR